MNILTPPTRIGLLTLKDPRSHWARVTLNGADVTRGLPDAPSAKIIAAHDGQGLDGGIGYVFAVTPERFQIVRHGDVRITFEPADGVPVGKA